MPFEDLFYSYKISIHIVIVGFPSELTFRVSKGKVNSAARPRSARSALGRFIVTVFEIEKVVLRKVGFRAAYAVLQVGQRFGPCERKYWKRLTGEVSEDNLAHRKAVLLLEAAEPLKKALEAGIQIGLDFGLRHPGNFHRL